VKYKRQGEKTENGEKEMQLNDNSVQRKVKKKKRMWTMAAPVVR
jgi:hypothetical protein